MQLVCLHDTLHVHTWMLMKVKLYNEELGAKLKKHNAKNTITFWYKSRGIDYKDPGPPRPLQG